MFANLLCFVFFWLILPRVDGAGDSVVAVVHGVWSPAVAPHALRAVVSGHSQVLRGGSRKKDDERDTKKNQRKLSGRREKVVKVGDAE